MRTEERTFSASKWNTQLRNSVVIGEVALCVVLLGAAGLLTQSFLRMSTMRSGLRTDHVLMVSLDLMPDRYADWLLRRSAAAGEYHRRRSGIRHC